MAMRTEGRGLLLGAAVLAAVLLALACAPVASQNAATSPGDGAAVDLALVLAVDCSSSVTAAEYNQQMQGLAEAIRSPDVIAAMTGGQHQRVAISVLQWAGANSQAIVVPWTVIDSEAAAGSLAARLAAMPRSANDNSTAIGAAIEASMRHLLDGPYAKFRKVIDVSSDGVNSAGPSPDGPRDAAVAAGITINALVILNEVAFATFYFRRHVVGGADAFVLVTADYESYRESMRKKLLRELVLPAM
jgi:Protein of unknown function (DUF1194)